jgi:hypothetical protein
MNGTIVEVINGGTVYLLLVDTGRQIVEHSVDHRCMSHIVEGEGLESAQDLRGRAVEVGEECITFTDAGPEAETSSPTNSTAADWKGQTQFGY